MWGNGWADKSCDSLDMEGFVCRLPTTRSTFFKVVNLVHRSLEQEVGIEYLWHVVLKHRWTADTLNRTKDLRYCLDTAFTKRVLESVERELKIDETKGKKEFEPDKYLQEALEIFSLIFYCPPQHLVEAIKLGIFYENLIENESPRTLVMATMNNISPNNSNKFENKDLLYKIFTELDKEYNFQLGPALIAISSECQLDEMAKLELPFLSNYKDLINKCIGEGQDCSQLDALVQSSGV